MLCKMKELRIKRGLTQKELSDYVGIRQTAYSNYELGIRKMSVDIAKKIAKVLEVDWWVLYE